MSDLQEIVKAAQGRRAVLATVVQVAGSAYRRPGARMLFPDGAEPLGLVSGLGPGPGLQR
jgi:xanthine/CO dehydrogenase XdhC/CoxF family maturation factor